MSVQQQLQGPTATASAAAAAARREQDAPTRMANTSNTGDKQDEPCGADDGATTRVLRIAVCPSFSRDFSAESGERRTCSRHPDVITTDGRFMLDMMDLGVGQQNLQWRVSHNMLPRHHLRICLFRPAHLRDTRRRGPASGTCGRTCSSLSSSSLFADINVLFCIPGKDWSHSREPESNQHVLPVSSVHRAKLTDSQRARLPHAVSNPSSRRKQESSRETIISPREPVRQSEFPHALEITASTDLSIPPLAPFHVLKLRGLDRGNIKRDPHKHRQAGIPNWRPRSSPLSSALCPPTSPLGFIYWLASHCQAARRRARGCCGPFLIS